MSSRSGFTLIELIVTIAITALLTGILIIYSNQSRSQILLNTEKAKVAQTISRVRSLALAGFTDPPSVPPPCAYGFYIDYPNHKYLIFEYTPADCSIVLGSDTINPSLFTKIISEETLSEDLDFDVGADRLGYLIFIPPEPKVLIFDEAGNSFNSSMNIYLKTKDDSLKTTIMINNQTGQISF